MSYYRYHVFFCTNQRTDGRECCEDCNAQAMREYAKARSKELRLSGQGGGRINSAGCLDRCSEGPVMVIYPQGTWYTYVDKEDIDEILSKHLQQGEIVARLQI